MTDAATTTREPAPPASPLRSGDRAEFRRASRCRGSATRELPPAAESTSVHLVVVFPIPVARRIRRPSGPFVATAIERIAADRAPHEADRRQDERKQRRQPDARHDMSERARELPPVPAPALEET